MDINFARKFTKNSNYGKPPKRDNPQTPSTQKIMAIRALMRPYRTSLTPVPWRGSDELRRLRLLMRKLERQFERKKARANKIADQMTAGIENATARKISREKIVKANMRGVSGSRMMKKAAKVEQRIFEIENAIRSLKGELAL